MSDAQIVVRWLNEAQRAERAHVLSLHNELESLASGLSALQKMEATGPVMRALKGEIARSELKPDAAYTAKYRRAFRKLKKQMKTLNETLRRRYAFHPGIGYTIITDMRGAGLVSDADKRAFRLIVGEWELVEADVALSLVRLYLRGELERVRLCERCKRRWVDRAKSHYRFCSDECRESYYTESDDYYDRKADNQRNYRERKKLAEARGVSLK
jgi:hypothetical protein